MLEELSITKL